MVVVQLVVFHVGIFGWAKTCMHFCECESEVLNNCRWFFARWFSSRLTMMLKEIDDFRSDTLETMRLKMESLEAERERWFAEVPQFLQALNSTVHCLF